MSTIKLKSAQEFPMQAGGITSRIHCRSIACLLTSGALLWAAMMNLSWADSTFVEHNLEVWLHPDQHKIRITDHIKAPQHAAAILQIHPKLKLKVLSGSLESLNHQQYRLAPSTEVQLSLQGALRSQRKTTAAGYDRGIEYSGAHIGKEGVFLPPSTGWYPAATKHLERFRMKVHLPDGWSALSQGSTEIANQFDEPSAQLGIWLIAARYHRYRSEQEPRLEALLRSDDPALAQRYLDAGAAHLRDQEALLGPYPYSRFTLAENFWESGFGMPGFTLLGSRVIRLPFILHSSYPHEILHNWFGNGVYVDEGGNWSEGLTTYLSDHRQQQRRGKAIGYRLRMLQRYANHAAGQRDFPLSQFRSRHNEAAQSVGYAKAMMMFHMLRQRLGDETFVYGLRDFVKNHRFQMAGYGDLQRSWEQASSQDLSSFFQQWVYRTGAPKLEARLMGVFPTTDSCPPEGWEILLETSQTQEGDAFELHVPVLIDTQLGMQNEEVLLSDKKKQIHRLGPFKSRPQLVRIDPRFDLFRTLLPGESPVSLSKLFGAEKVLIVLPNDVNELETEAYRQFSNEWKQDGRVQIVKDNELQKLPENTAIWLLGINNQWLPATWAKQVASGSIKLPKHQHPLSQTALATVLPQAGTTMGWIVLGKDAQATRIAQRLRHYGRYGFVSMQGPTRKDVTTGEWPADQSPLMFSIPDEEGRTLQTIPPVPARPMLIPPAETRSYY